MRDDLPDGLYLDLGEDDYFKQKRLGSTDLVRLLRAPADWWYASAHNPDRIDDASPERDFGKALHLLILEGEKQYRRRVSISPFADFRAKEAQAWRAETLAAGRTILSLDQDRRVTHMANLILNHPEYAGPLRSGLPEVSVLFHLGGHALRARLDLLLPRFILDLKSFGGHVRGRDVNDKALRIIAERDYDVQRYVYDIARARLTEFIRAGNVFGAALERLGWLTQLAEEKDWSWVWLFYQRRDDRAGRAPVVLPIERPRFDVTFDTGREKTAAALTHYADFVGRFGLDAPWAVVAPMWRPLDHEFPPWLKDYPRPENDNHFEELDDAV